jgi:hypothetical protein
MDMPRTLFTRENAAEMARRSNAIQRERRSEPRSVALSPGPAIGDRDPYVAARLMRVREQLNRFDSMMAKETDPQRLDRLASAQSRLSEQERILAGRPLPGSKRPLAEAPRRREIPRMAPSLPWRTANSTPS